MKKNLILTICFCLALGVSSGMANSFTDGPWDTVIAYGALSLTGQNPTAEAETKRIFDAYIDGFSGAIATFGNCSDFTIMHCPGNQTSVNPNVETFKDYGFDWTYAIVSSQTGMWYLIQNTYGDAQGSWLPKVGETLGLYDETLGMVLVDVMWDFDGNLIKSVERGMWNDAHEFACNGSGCPAQTNFNQLYVTAWIGQGCIPTPENNFCQGEPIPEPGTILLLGTGIIGLGLVARRKMTKK